MQAVTKVIITLIITTALMASGWYIFNELKKAYIEQKKIDFIKNSVEQIGHLITTAALPETHEHVCQLQGRIAKAQQELEEVTRSWHVDSVVEKHRAQWIQRLKDRLIVQRDMLHNYQEQLRNLTTLGKTESQQGDFAADKLHIAQQEIEKLQDLLAHCYADIQEVDRDALQDIITSNKQALHSYQEQLEDLLQSGAQHSDSRVELMRDQVVQKAIEIGDIQERLYYSDHSTTI